MNMSKRIAIPSSVNASGLAAALYDGQIPADAPPEHLHAVVCQLCEIVARLEGEVEALKSAGKNHFDEPAAATLTKAAEEVGKMTYGSEIEEHRARYAPDPDDTGEIARLERENIPGGYVVKSDLDGDRLVPVYDKGGAA